MRRMLILAALAGLALLPLAAARADTSAEEPLFQL
jgi:hypothetical protein